MTTTLIWTKKSSNHLITKLFFHDETAGYSGGFFCARVLFHSFSAELFMVSSQTFSILSRLFKWARK
jgi:hypothetical protein